MRSFTGGGKSAAAPTPVPSQHSASAAPAFGRSPTSNASADTPRNVSQTLAHSSSSPPPLLIVGIGTTTVTPRVRRTSAATLKNSPQASAPKPSTNSSASSVASPAARGRSAACCASSWPSAAPSPSTHARSSEKARAGTACGKASAPKPAFCRSSKASNARSGSQRRLCQ